MSKRAERRRESSRRGCLWPVQALLSLPLAILKLTGRTVGVAVGFVFIVVGLLISLTIIGAVVGIPLALLGALLMARALF